MPMQCKKCDTKTTPKQDFVHIKTIPGHVKMERYICEKCNWVWATDDQRKYNNVNYHETIKVMTQRGWS